MTLIGQRFYVMATMQKTYQTDHLAQRSYLVKVTWHRQRNAPFFGYYIGYRTISDGLLRKTLLDGEGWSDKFEVTQRHKVLLIVRNERQNPLRVAYDDAVAIPNTCPNCGWSNFLLFHPNDNEMAAFTMCKVCLIDVVDNEDLPWLSQRGNQWIDDYTGKSVNFVEVR